MKNNILLQYNKLKYFLKSLSWPSIKEYFKTNLLQTKDSNKVIVFSVMLGIFMSIIPVWGYQFVVAIALCYVLKLNKVIVGVAVNVSLFPMMPIILYLSLVTGGFVLGKPMIAFNKDAFTIVQMKSQLIQYFIGSIVFAVLASLLSGVITFLLLAFFRKKQSV